jgi:hypothetical protein
MLSVDSGSKLTLRGGTGGVLIYTMSGGGTIGDRNWSRGSGLRLEIGEESEIVANQDSQMFLIDLPTP